jgi:hypothetical protein
MRLEMKRMAPGETNTWFIEVLGTEGGVRYSTKEPKTLWVFENGKEQFWKKTDLGFGMPFKAVTGGIFEPGFPDVIQQMWAAYLDGACWFAERSFRLRHGGGGRRHPGNLRRGAGIARSKESSRRSDTALRRWFRLAWMIFGKVCQL